MKVNQTSTLITPDIVLVPYCKHHVEKYHTWMQDPHLQALTASEPLTLSEECSMQQSWRQDADKLTFIVCVPQDNQTSPTPSQTTSFEESETARMLGDINLFISDDMDDQDSPIHVGEIELMIAESNYRGKGLGSKILAVFLAYISLSLEAIMEEYTGGKGGNLEYLRVKIGASNKQSLRLFEKAGFVGVSEEPNYFGELEMRMGVEKLTSSMKGMNENMVVAQYVTSEGEAYE